MSTHPTHIGAYEVVRLLGRGGMGAVYLARDPAIGRLVAIKLLREGVESDELRERFAREARAAGGLRHPNIVTIFQAGPHEVEPYLVMEYIPGDTLAQVVERRLALSVPRKLRIIEEVCHGLAYAHRAGIVHRDVKPANILVDPDGIVKILDFGIARMGEQGLTRSGMVVGSLNYMAPEQIDPGTADHRSDVFAVGLVLYELLTYQKAFPGQDFSVFHRILHTEPAPIETVCEGVPPDLSEIVGRALKKNPDDRYQDLAGMRAALSRVRMRLRRGHDDVSDEGPLMASSDAGRSSEEDSATQPSGSSAIEALLTDARQALDAGRFADAIAACDKVVALVPDHQAALDLRGASVQAAALVQAQALLGVAQEEWARGDESRVREVLREAEQVADGITLPTELGLRLSTLKDEMAALDAARNAARQLVARGEAALAGGALDEALAVHGRAHELAPADASVVQFGRELARARREAEEAAERARLEAEAEAQRQAAAKAAAEEAERRRQAEEQARLEAEARARREAEEAAERARLEAEAEAEAQRQAAARAAAEEAERRRLAEEQARLEAEARARREAEEAAERARQEAQEAAERARLDAEAEAQRQAAARAQAEDRARRDAHAAAIRVALDAAARQAAAGDHPAAIAAVDSLRFDDPALTSPSLTELERKARRLTKQWRTAQRKAPKTPPPAVGPPSLDETVIVPIPIAPAPSARAATAPAATAPAPTAPTPTAPAAAAPRPLIADSAVRADAGEPSPALQTQPSTNIRPAHWAAAAGLLLTLGLGALWVGMSPQTDDPSAANGSTTDVTTPGGSTDVPGPATLEAPPDATTTDDAVAATEPDAEPEATTPPAVRALHDRLASAIRRADVSAALALVERAEPTLVRDPLVQADLDRLLATARRVNEAALASAQEADAPRLAPSEHQSGLTRRTASATSLRQGDKPRALRALVDATAAFTQAAAAGRAAAVAERQQTPIEVPTQTQPSPPATTAGNTSAPPPVAPRPEPVQEPPPNPPPVAAPTQPVDETPAIRAVLDLFVRGYETLDVALVRRAWPSAPATLTFDNVRSQSVTLQNVRISQTGETATVSCTRQITTQLAAGRPQSASQAVTFSMRRNAGGWIITSVTGGR